MSPMSDEPQTTGLKTSQISPFTRASKWSLKDSLILISVISEVEGNRSNEVSSYQKWKMIAEGCCSFDVIKTSIQCHKKWNGLLGEYEKIKLWESENGIGSYWSLTFESRKDLMLPLDLSQELFRAVHNFVKAEGDISYAEFDDSSGREFDETTPSTSSGLIKITVGGGGDGDQIEIEKVKMVFKGGDDGGDDGNGGDGDQIETVKMVSNVCQSAERVKTLAEEKFVSDIRTDIIRGRADELISCFRDIEENLRQLLCHVHNQS